jgi:hypothetical protein
MSWNPWSKKMTERMKKKRPSLISALLKRHLFSSKSANGFIRRPGAQIRAWKRANRKMGWRIPEEAFARIGEPLEITDQERGDGFVGPALFYGFGDDGQGHADAVLSGKLAWEYAVRSRKWRGGTWTCGYVKFDDSQFMRLREGTRPRPPGFYFSKVQLGGKYHRMSVERVRKQLGDEVGFGPEGIQFLAITHPHYIKMMDGGDIPFIFLPDYDVAPHGFGDFFDAPFLLATGNRLGLGVGNVSRPYPKYGSGTFR